jgi:hypothetical protein
MVKKYLLSPWIFIVINCLVGISCFAQAKLKYEAYEGFVAHEWGTFTTLHKSNGEYLTGLQVEEEHLPSFVQDLCFCPTYHTRMPAMFKGYPDIIGNPTVVATGLLNVTVKMETPVLYFYSSEPIAKSLTVDVKFYGGSISQWYPPRIAGELYSGPFYLNSGYYNYPYPPLPPARIIDFSIPLREPGWIRWKISVLPLNTQLKYTNDKSLETPVWTSPRATASNLVKTSDPNGQVEKFLFYRGMGNFQEPIKVEFNAKRQLVISNSGEETLKYVMVYEKRKDGTAFVWGSSVIESKKNIVFKTPTPAVNRAAISPEDELENFVSKLVEAGLYEDEARAMLKTWDKSYFQHEGLKVFWIVPPAFTESVMPLQINPKPKVIKRVLVGRSEILSPEFEKELSEMGPAAFRDNYSQDRFYLAYEELISHGIPKQWTHYTDASLEEMAVVNTDIEVFPNPTMRKLTVKINSPGTIKVIATNGMLIKRIENAIAGENVMDIEILPEGVYIIHVDFAGGLSTTKKIIKR